MEFNSYSMGRKIWLNLYRKYVRRYHRFEVQGWHNIPKNSGFVLAPNHGGGVDIDSFVLSTCLPRRCWVLYNDEHYYSPFWGHFIRNFHLLPLRIGDKTGIDRLNDVFQKVFHEFHDGVVMFPEGNPGTIFNRYKMEWFKPGVIRIALKHKIPIIPTAAIGFPEAIPVYKESRSDPKRPGFGWLTTFLPLPRKLLVECGSPIYFEDYYAEKELSRDTEDYLAEIVRKEVEKLLQKHVPQYVQRLPKGLTKTEDLKTQLEQITAFIKISPQIKDVHPSA
ncbi:MAG: lysophospholipid acyltransferase family protein [Promethearchaeota archaeon]